MKKLRKGLAVDILGVLQSMFLLLLAARVPAYGSEQDALWISNNIQALHMPYNVIIDPVFATPTSAEVVSYSRGGNASIWTGHYLAAEAFRYKVTNSPEAIDNLRRALAGIRSLVDVTGTNLLARCVVPTDSPHAQAMITEEAGHGIFTGTLGDKTYYWIGNTVRDEYAGVFFGLGVAYDAVEDCRGARRHPGDHYAAPGFSLAEQLGCCYAHRRNQHGLLGSTRPAVELPAGRTSGKPRPL